jgi:hypothetical protein
LEVEYKDAIGRGFEATNIHIALNQHFGLGSNDKPKAT